MNIIITIITLLLLSYLLNKLANKIKVPSVVALILGGVIVGYPFLKSRIIEPNTHSIIILGDIALICLMFLAGLEGSWKKLYSEKKDALFISVFAFMTPLVLGFLVFKLLGFSYVVSAIGGICLSITAEGTTARVLLEIKKIRTKIGEAILGAGIIDDVLGLFLFIIITFLLKESYLTDSLFIVGAIVSFFVGFAVQNILENKKDIIQKIEKLLTLLIIPFFFFSMGISFEFSSLFLNIHLAVLIILIAMVGKIAGTIMTKPFVKLRFKQLHIIGWAMNSRGAVELALALIALRSGLIPTELYSGLVLMALVTTLIFPVIITKMIKNDKKVMN